MMRTTLLLVPLLFLASCGDPPNRLYGSMSQVYPLDFNTVRATLVGDQISIEYLRMSGQTTMGMTAKATVSIGDIQPVAGNDIDMTELLASGLPRGTVQRVESDGTTDFALLAGKIHFNQEPVANADITGWFHTTLSTDSADTTNRTLNGNFQTKVEAL
jgi:hypothetical protein